MTTLLFRSFPSHKDRKEHRWCGISKEIHGVWSVEAEWESKRDEQTNGLKCCCCNIFRYEAWANSCWHYYQNSIVGRVWNENQNENGPKPNVNECIYKKKKVNSEFHYQINLQSTATQNMVSDSRRWLVSGLQYCIQNPPRMADRLISFYLTYSEACVSYHSATVYNADISKNQEWRVSGGVLARSVQLKSHLFEALCSGRRSWNNEWNSDEVRHGNRTK